MVDFNPINAFREAVKLNTDTTKQQPAAQLPNTPLKADVAKEPLTVDMSELELKAEMNKALGFEKTDKAETNYAKVDAEFAKNPVAFAARYATPEVRDNAQQAGVEFDALATVSRTFSPERQQQVVEGFANHNPSPNAFTGEFLELFC